MDFLTLLDVSGGADVYADFFVTGLYSWHVRSLDDDEFCVGRLCASFVIGKLCHAVSFFKLSEPV
jgi:hypothetical protein